ncbi:hypothetical protein CBS101457_001596 [Exobasidium rhododendri]|nr:hypothetical protein CBS101457_001596 [Exobasidium rhododendri]
MQQSIIAITAGALLVCSQAVALPIYNAPLSPRGFGSTTDGDDLVVREPAFGQSTFQSGNTRKPPSICEYVICWQITAHADKSQA